MVGKTMVLMLAAALASGCVIVTDREDWGESDIHGGSNWEDRQNHNHQFISGLRLGASMESIRAALGEPDFTEAYRSGDSDITILRYRTAHRHSDGETTHDETTPLIFDNGILTGWGETVLAQTLG